MAETITLKCLPLRGLSSQDFSVWKESVVKQLELNIDHTLFLPGGLYCSWICFKDSRDRQRILDLHPLDPAKLKLDIKPENIKCNEQDLKLLLEDLLIGRNNQLNEFIEMMCDLTSNLNQATVKDLCTTFDHIIDLVAESYEFTEKPSNILGLSHVELIVNEDYNAFYARLRAQVCDRLKIKGAKIKDQNGAELLEDEIISPTFEEVIILWCLEKIDHRLPDLTNQTFGEKLNGDVTLKDLQPEIFHNISNLLESDKSEELVQDVEEDPLEDRTKVEKENKIEYTETQIKDEYEGDDGGLDLEYDLTDTNEILDEFSKDYVSRDSTGKLKCQDCSKRFSNKKKLWDHSRIHRVEPSICEFCEKQFRCKKALIDHISKRHKVSYTCNFCSEVLIGQAKYEKHLKDSHFEEYKEFCNQKNNSTGFLCRYCQESLSSQQELRKHILKHKEQNEITYTETGVKKRGPVAQPIEFTNKEVVCDMCGKNVGLKYIKQHKKRHSLDNMICTICEIKYLDRKDYLRHMRGHRTVVKNASCDQCGQTFTQPAHLRKHMKIHEIGGEKMKCETCMRTFFDEEEMGLHVCKHHACDICGVKFLRVRNMEFHRKMHFGEVIFSCDQCESSFLSKKRLNEHINYQHKREKKYKCDHCDKRFIMKSGLAQHNLTHTGEKPFKCDECNQRFTQKGNLETHLKLHTDETPYGCTGCTMRFRQAGDLKRHREQRKCGFTQKDFYGQEEETIIKLITTDSII